ncbi:MAG: alpha/beta hydrolase [Oligoflexales bacterium]|nr:alpha/beta hydrolase [Oligoflexales bacterium]
MPESTVKISNQYTFVLLRGLARETKHWGPFETALSQVDYCKKIILCDLPGMGVYHKSDAPSSISKIVSFVQNKLQDKLQKKEDLFLIGLSLGGMVAYEYIRRNPGLFSKAVIINSSFRGLSPVYERVRPAALFKLLQIMAIKEPSKREEKILPLISNFHVEDPKVLQKFIEICTKRPVRIRNVVSQLLAASRYRFKLTETLNTEGMVLCSSEDRLVNSKCSHAFAAALGWPIREHSLAGHDLPLDAPEWIIEEISKFT